MVMVPDHFDVTWQFIVFLGFSRQKKSTRSTFINKLSYDKKNNILYNFFEKNEWSNLMLKKSNVL